MLDRLASSRYADRFVLKGAMLVNIWMGGSDRPTRDLDLRGYGDAWAEHLTSVVEEVCAGEVGPDDFASDRDKRVQWKDFRWL